MVLPLSVVGFDLLNDITDILYALVPAVESTGDVEHSSPRSRVERIKVSVNGSV
jgi:hypothetical protein